VTYQAQTDGKTELSLDGTSWVTTLTIDFSTADTGVTSWNTMRIVQVRGVDDNLPQGLHFSRVTHGVTSDAGLLIGLTSTDVTNGLAASINGDPSGSFRAAANDPALSGATLTVNGRAFTASFSADVPTISIDMAHSVRAFVNDLNLTLSGTVNTGDIWRL